jgi:hypothetical protein
MLDWWLAARWRALLTWVVLAGVSAWIVHDWWGRFSRVVWLFTEMVNSVSPVAFPAAFNSVAHSASGALFAWWYEPFVLRLSLARGAAWLSVRIGCVAVFTLLAPRSIPYWWILSAVFVVPSVILVPVLWGWRSRPWMPIVCGTLCVALYSLQMSMWIRSFVFQVLWAVLLLYGTRLLSAEEREKREKRRKR